MRFGPFYLTTPSAFHWLCLWLSLIDDVIGVCTFSMVITDFDYDLNAWLRDRRKD